MENFVRDLRYVSRALVRSPAFSAIAILTLALGIGATTAIFSVIHGVLLRPLPYPDAERIVEVWQVNAEGGQVQVSDPNFEDWQAQSRSFAALAQFAGPEIASVSGAGEPTRARVAIVSRGFFDALGVRLVRGRTFANEEQREGGVPALILSHSFWQRQMGGKTDFSSITLTFENRAHAVIGVMPPALDYPAGTDIWISRELFERNPHRTGHNWRAIGRLTDGVSLEQARRDMSALAKRLKQQYGDETMMADVALIPLQEGLVGEVRPALLVLLAASAVLLLIACANVVNLIVARLAARRGELALRIALGAGTRRLAQQVLTESLVLSVVAGAVGVALAALGVRVLLALDPGNLPRAEEIGLSWPVLLFAAAVSGSTALPLGLLAALRATRGDIRTALAQSQRTQAGVGSSFQIRNTLVVAQVAMTLVLLVGAGLLGRSFMRLVDVDPGYRTERAVVLDLSVTGTVDPGALRERVAFYDNLLAGLAAIPGVGTVGGVSRFPLAGGQSGDGTFLIMSSPDEKFDMADVPRLMRDPARTGDAEFRVASGGYFRTMNIPLIDGRVFDDRDAPDAPHVAVISTSLAKAEWPNESPLGRIIQFGNMDGDIRPFTIVGIVGDVREASLASAPRPTFYAHYRQRPVHASAFNFVIQGNADPAATTAAARRVVSALRPDIPPRFRTIETVVAASIADRRFVLVLVGVFGAAALVLATLGVYSVISYLVTQRRQEIGVRMALGAQTEDVLRLVLRQGASLALIGIALGVAAALALTRLLAGLLFGVSSTDPLAFGAVILMLTVVALLASYVPARRATRVDPMSILRG